MEFAGHKKIKDFSIDGQIYDDADFMRLREQYESIMDEYMRVKGYVPHLDVDPVFTTNYNGHLFNFKITWYGVYIGKAKAKCFKGVSQNKLIPLSSMEKNRLEKFSQSVE